MLFDSLCIVSCVNLKENKLKFRNLIHDIFMLPIRVSDYRAVGPINHGACDCQQ